MSVTKCASFCARLKRFSGANLKISVGNRLLGTHGGGGFDEAAERTSDVQLEKEKLCETEAMQLLNKYERNFSATEHAETLQEIWKASASAAKSSSAFCNAYLRVCTENGVKIDYKSFLEIAKTKADAETFHWLLTSVCYDGDVGSIVEVLGAMKDAGIPADESVFNMIVLGHVVNSGIEGGRSVLKTMKAAKIPISDNTHWSTLKGLCRRTDRNEFLDTLRDTPGLIFNEDHFYDILYTLGLHDNQLWMQDFFDFIGKDSVPRRCWKDLENVCYRLIRRGKPEAAYCLYTQLGEVHPDGGFGVGLMDEMLLRKTPIETIINICKDMVSTSRNTSALLDLTELTLKGEHFEQAVRTFSELETLRPHYFWPLFLRNGELFGERGVLEILDKMCEFGVQPDYDTVGYYLLKYCDLSDLDALLGRLEPFVVLTMKDVVTPVIYCLLNEDRLDEAREFCANHKQPLIGERILRQLSLVWKRTRKSEPIVYILQRICETNPPANDWTGKFLLRTLKLCKATEDYEEAVLLIDLLREKELKISSLISDHIYHMLRSSTFSKSDYAEEIEAAVDKLLDVSKPDSLHIQHPRDMNLEELECHYTELKSKNMETRGVLRRLIQGYSRVNNQARVEELSELFKTDSYKESAGMKASMLNTYVQGKNLEGAKGVYEELKRDHPRFSLDSFKVIDYAQLLVEAGESAVAVDVLRDETIEIRKTEPIKKNCWRLLNATQNPDDARMLYEVLVERKYCGPNNIILGPLVRAHLKTNDLAGAVNTYINCANEYRCTPLQQELLSAAIKTKDDLLVGKILDATTQVHGLAATKFALLASLAENGMEKPLQKFLMEKPKIDGNVLRKRCERWVNENKVVPLETLLNSARRLSSSVVDLNLVRLSILKIYGAQNDCEAALHFWQRCSEEDEIKISPQLTQELLKLLERCKFQIPDALKVYAT